VRETTTLSEACLIDIRTMGHAENIIAFATHAVACKGIKRLIVEILDVKGLSMLLDCVVLIKCN